MKPGLKTTEFWIAALTAIGSVLGALKDVLPPTQAATIATVCAAVYGIARGLTKLGHGMTGDDTDDQDPAPPPASGTAAALLALGLGILLFGTGCTSLSRLTTARIQIQCGTNSVTVVQPKDTTIKKFVFNPATGQLEMQGYASSANAAAIASATAQWEAADSIVTKALSFVEKAGGMAASAYGIPVPSSPAQAQAAPAAPAVRGVPISATSISNAPPAATVVITPRAAPAPQPSPARQPHPEIDPTP